jgi:hypothetical protein
MNISRLCTTKGLILAFAVCLLTLGLVIAGCSGAGSSNLITAPTTTVPVSITDASANPILGVSMTIDSIILTDTASKTTGNLLKNPAPFEAIHMDAVQEPFLVPPVPMDTYSSITITVSNPTVAFIDPNTHQVTVAQATLAVDSFTQNFSPAITIDSTHPPLLFDFLVEKSVTITAGTPSTVSVTPTFNVALAPLPKSGPPTNGTNGLLTGFKGHVTAIDTTDTPQNFTITDGNGNTHVIDVNSGCASTVPGQTGCTVFETDAGTLLAGISALQLDAIVEVDAAIQSTGSLLALRVEVHDPGANPKQLFLGPVTAVTGTPATSFTMLVREQLGKGTTPAAAPATDTITLSTAQFIQPPRLGVLAAVQPFVFQFDKTTIFAGQHVAVLTTGVVSGSTPPTAPANFVLLQPQTLTGAYVSSTAVGGGYTKYVLTLPSTSWLATLTGYTNVNVFTNALMQPINSSTAAPVVGQNLRFHGFLFRNTNTQTLELVADVQADPPGTPILPHN